MKTVRAFIFLVFSAVPALLCASDSIIIGGLDGLDPHQRSERYEIALALSGGGARGFATIGILKAFEEKNLGICAVTGTSMGGVIGGLFAAGYTPDRLAKIVHNTEFDKMFTNAPARRTMFLTQRQERDRHLLSVRFNRFVPVIPKALTAGQKLTNILTNLTTRANYHSAGDYSRLPIPFKTICTDVVSGKEVIVDRGSLADAMRATMAFPLAFTGVERNGQLLMDGGMVTPIPVELVKEMCQPGTFIVAVNTASPLLPREELDTPVDIANQVTTIMTADKLRSQLSKADYQIQPPLNGVQPSDFKYRDSLIDVGYQIGLKATDSIIMQLSARQDSLSYLVSEVEFDGRLEACRRRFAAELLHRILRHNELVAVLKELVVELGLFRLQAEISPATQHHEVFEANGRSVEAISLRLSGWHHLRLPDVTFRFNGSSIFEDSVLVRQFATDDTLLTPENLRLGLDRILKLYYDKRYNLADICSTLVDPDRNVVTLTIDEAVIKSIEVENNKRSRDWFIKSYFPLEVGEPYSTGRAARGIANIFGTDLYERVTIDLVSIGGGAHVRIGVVEKKYSQLRLGWHWDDEYNSEEFIEFLNDNVFGIGLEYLLHARFGKDRQRYHLSLKSNRLGKTYLTAQAGLRHERLDRQLYNEDSSPGSLHEERSTGFDIRLGQQIARLGTVTAAINLREVKYRHVRTGVEDEFGLRIFKIESLVETFDRISFPESGKKHLFELQLVGKFLGGDVEFTKFFSSLEAYFPFAGVLNYHPRLSVGISRSGLPLSEKFFIGGMNSFAGYHTGELYGDKVFLLNNEVRLKLPLRLYLIGRYDVGDVYRHTDEIKLSNLRHGVGISLGFDSPIGPLECGYGTNDGDIDRLYLSAGLSF